jgi:hypothetical protein
MLDQLEWPSLESLLRKPMVEFALLQMLLMCGPHFRSDVIVQPRYFAEVTCSSECPWRLFLFYINDMPEGITSKVRLFADDTIAYLTISSDQDARTLNNQI